MGWELAIGGGVLGAVSGFVGSFMSAAQEEAQAKFQSKLAARNAKQEQIYADLARQQAAAAAQATENATDFEAAKLRRVHAIQLSENRSLLGASGLQNTGSNLLFAIDNAITARVDEENTLINGRYQAELQRYEGAINAYKHETQAAQLKAQSEYYSDVASAAGSRKWWGGALGGLSGALSGAASGVGITAGAAKLGLVSKDLAGGSLLGSALRSTRSGA